MSKRLKTIGMGLAIVAAECLVVATPAAADVPVKSASECRKLGGHLVKYVNGKLECENTDKDKACRRELGDRAYWSHEGKECRVSSMQACFLTTACVDGMALRDDCFELRTLRRFRDEHLTKMAGGDRDILEYYRTAPAIVEAIASRKDSQSELARLYVLYILPSALCAKVGANGATRRIYTAMMRDLSDRYSSDIG